MQFAIAILSALVWVLPTAAQSEKRLIVSISIFFTYYVDRRSMSDEALKLVIFHRLPLEGALR